MESLATGENRIVRKDLHELYGHVVSAIKGSLFDTGRWHSLAVLNFGGARALADRQFEYVRPCTERSGVAVEAIVSNDDLATISPACLVKGFQAILTTDSDPSLWKKYAELGESFFERDQVIRAMEVYSEIAKAFPDEAAAHYLLADVQKTQGTFAFAT